MTELRISRDKPLRTWFMQDSLWHHPHQVRDFPLPSVVRFAMRWHGAPGLLRTIVARLALWRLDAGFRSSIEAAYALLESNTERMHAMAAEVEQTFGRSLGGAIRIVVTPHEWAASSADDISIGIRPPELVASFPVGPLRHEVIHIAYARSMPAWKAKGLHLYREEEALELAVAILAQRMAGTARAMLDMTFVSVELRTFAAQHHAQLDALLMSHNSPVSLLESVDRMVDEYIHAKA